MKEEQGAIYEESVIMLMGRYVYASCILTLKSFVQNIYCSLPLTFQSIPMLLPLCPL